MIHAGIIGGAGYTAGELTRILLRHPEVTLKYIHSRSQAGKAVSSIHDDLIGDTDSVFTNELYFEGLDVLFFCGGHGQTEPFLAAHTLPEDLSLIDLSNAFRLQSREHSFVYGLPELQRELIEQSTLIANPGCFATCIQLGLLPLAKSGNIKEEMHVTAMTGSTGAGQKPSATTHFSWRNNNISVYKAFSHQHLPEIRQSLEQLQPGLEPPMRFVPMRGDFTRGILASIYLKSDLSEGEAVELYEEYYRSHPFTHVTAQNPHIKQVVQTNKGLVYVKKYEDTLHIISVIDNLLKGASGQAVQNMNLMFGLDETTGLQLKAGAF